MGSSVIDVWASCVRLNDVIGAEAVIEELNRPGTDRFYKLLCVQQGVVKKVRACLKRGDVAGARAQLPSLSQKVRRHFHNLIRREERQREQVEDKEAEGRGVEGSGSATASLACNGHGVGDIERRLQSFLLHLTDGLEKNKPRRVLTLLQSRGRFSAADILQRIWNEEQTDASLKNLVLTVSRLNARLRKELCGAVSIVCTPANEYFLHISSAPTDALEEKKLAFAATIHRSQKIIFERLWEGRGTVVAYGDLCQALWETADVTEDRKKSIIQAVHRLNRSLREDHAWADLIAHDGRGYELRPSSFGRACPERSRGAQDDIAQDDNVG